MVSKDPVKIWFVTWPDGKVMEDTQNSISDSHAVAKAIASFLPRQWFPDLEIGSTYHGAGNYLWPSMKKAGFKVQSVDVPGATGVSR